MILRYTGMEPKVSHTHTILCKSWIKQRTALPLSMRFSWILYNSYTVSLSPHCTVLLQLVPVEDHAVDEKTRRYDTIYIYDTTSVLANCTLIP